jgi:hypothetical protein
MNVDYNAYVHARPDGGVFYVGKGSTKRSLEMTRSRNAHHASIVKKYGAENILVGTLNCSSDAISLELERGLIKCFRRMGVELANKTDGGEGTRGLKKSSEECSDISQRMLSFWADPVNRTVTTAAIQNAYTDQGLRDRLSKAMLGNSRRVGHKNSAEHNEILRQVNIGRTQTVEARQKISTARKGSKASDSTRAKISAAGKLRYANPENRLKTSEDTRRGIQMNKLNKEHAA